MLQKFGGILIWTKGAGPRSPAGGNFNAAAKWQGHFAVPQYDVNQTRDNSRRRCPRPRSRHFRSINGGPVSRRPEQNPVSQWISMKGDNWEQMIQERQPPRRCWLGMQETARQMIAQGPMEGHPYKLINVGSIASRKRAVDVDRLLHFEKRLLAADHCGAIGLAEHNITVNGYATRVVVHPAMGAKLTRIWSIIGVQRNARVRPMTISSATRCRSNAVSYPKEVSLARRVVPWATTNSAT